MRVRPEVVFQLLSEAFDKSLVDRTAIVKNGRICFECDIATITLEPSADGYQWELLYKAKETMFNKNIFPHTDDEYTIPDSLYNWNVRLSFTRIDPMMRMIYGGEKSCSAGTFDILNRNYSDALREGTISRDGNTLTFYSGFNSQKARRYLLRLNRTTMRQS